MEGERSTRRQWLASAGWLVGAAIGGGLLRGTQARPAAWLRPPGVSGSEADFLAACIRCGRCVQACPFDTLALAGIGAGASAGTPWLDARAVPCHLCKGEDSLLCIDACPSGALAPVAGTRAIRMGVAELDLEQCLAWNRQICRVCWRACPLPDEAIRFDPLGRVEIVAEACIGCGLCDWACPTEPSAIRMIPEAARPAGERRDLAAEPTEPR